MKKTGLVGIIIFALAATSFAQDNPDTAALNQRIAALYQQGKFKEAIPIAEKVVGAEKRREKGEIYAMALSNLAQLQKKYAEQLAGSLAGKDIRQRVLYVDEISESAGKAKKLFGEAVDQFRTLNLEESMPVASAKAELASVVYHFIVGKTAVEARGEIDNAEKLYLESIDTFDRLTPTPSDLELKAILSFGDFYRHYVNFEKAIPLFERYIAAVEHKDGPKSKDLIPALRAMMEIYFITDRDDDAKMTADRLSSITGKEEVVVPVWPTLTMRSRGIISPKESGFFHVGVSDNDSNDIHSMIALAAEMSSTGRVATKKLTVHVVVGENGEVVEAKATTVSKYDKQLEEAALASKFRAFSYNGVARKMRGSIVYSYLDR
jgi:tetratricopeptide (TPR) repeat protein